MLRNEYLQLINFIYFCTAGTALSPTCGAVDSHDVGFADEEAHGRRHGAVLQTTLDVHHSL